MALGIQECRNNALNFLKSNNFDVEKTLSRGFLNVTLLLTHKCNLSCPYCYQCEEFKQEDKVMTKETADKVIKFIYQRFDLHDITISIFGGEPFLNFEVMKYIVEKYPQLRFVVTTNGKVLSESKEIRDWVASQSHNLIVSLSFNALKPVYGKDILNKVTPVLELLKLNKGEVHYVVDDPLDEDQFSNVEYLLDLNIPQLRVTLPKEQEVIVTHKEDYIALFKRIADLVYLGGKKPLKFGWDTALKSNANRKVNNVELLSTSSSYCGAGFNYIAVDHNGDIYPCDYFVAFPEYKIGDIENGFDSELRVFKYTEDWHKQIYSYCNDCNLGDIRLCPNPMCYAENYKVNKNILMPTPNACVLREIEYEIYKYVSELNLSLKGKIAEKESIDESTIVV